MKLVLGKWATDRVAAGTPPELAAREAISYLYNRLGGHGGIILLGPDGRFGLAHNTPAMAWGLATPSGLSHHHGQVASLFEGIPHSFLQQGCLQSAPPQLRHCGRTAEQRHAIMQAQHSGSARLSVNLSQEARSLLARNAKGAHLLHKRLQFRMLVSPSPGADATPQLCLFRPHCADNDIG